MKKTKKAPSFHWWRVEKGLSLETIAAASGIKYPTLERWDRDDKRKPQDAQRDKLTAAYPDNPFVSKA